MTQLDPLGPGNHPDMGNQVDATAAASALAQIFSLLQTPTGGAVSGQSPDLFSDLKTTQQPDNTTTSDTSTSTTDSSSMPSGNAPDLSKEPVNQAYGHNGHPGIDLGLPEGTPLVALESGKITAAGNTDPNGYGNEVEITAPDGTVMRYGHLTVVGVKLGQSVTKGQPIGASGGGQGQAAGGGNATGPHLHFEVRKGGSTVDPVPYLSGSGGVVPGGSTDNPAAQTVAGTPETALKNVMAGLTGQPLQEDQQQTQDQQGQTQGTGSTADNDPNAVGSFLNAVKQHESGGNYQIYNQSGLSNASGAYQFIGSTWRGLGGSTANAAQASPQEQDRIAKQYALSLFNEFHSWRLAAIAWYGGPGVAQQAAQGQNVGSPQGQGSYTAYGDTIVRMMQGGK